MVSTLQETYGAPLMAGGTAFWAVADTDVAVYQQPVYLYVPPGHQKNWRKHCGRYNACGQPVYFVQERWIRDRYDERRGHDDRRDDRYDGRRDDRGDYRQDNGHGRDKHGKDDRGRHGRGD